MKSAEEIARDADFDPSIHLPSARALTAWSVNAIKYVTWIQTNGEWLTDQAARARMNEIIATRPELKAPADLSEQQQAIYLNQRMMMAVMEWITEQCPSMRSNFPDWLFKPLPA